MSTGVKTRPRYTWRKVDNLDTAIRTIGEEVTKATPGYGQDLVSIPGYIDGNAIQCVTFPSGKQLVTFAVTCLGVTRRDSTGNLRGVESSGHVVFYVGTPIPPEPEPERWGLFDRNGCSFRISKSTGTYTQAIALQFESEKEARAFVELNGLVNTFTPKKIEKKD